MKFQRLFKMIMSRILLVDHMKYINEKRRGFKLTLIPDLILPGKG